MDGGKIQQLGPAAERARRRRSLAIALTLGFMVIAFYVATFVRFGDVITNSVH